MREQGLATTSIVLVGGRSARLGRDKAMELVGGESLLQRILSRLATFSNEVILVMAQDQEEVMTSFYPQLKKIRDLLPGGGSLGGVYSGLTVSSSFHNLLVACDMPFLNIPLLRYLLEVSPPFDVVIPKLGDNLEPLHAIYSKNCIPPIRHLLEHGHHKIIDFFPQMKVKYVEEEELNRFDPEHVSFFNINTQEDLNRAQQLALSRQHLSL
ncbi:molybdenum cofactor guanylyltransferase [Chloroflexota bacterium]